MAEMTVAMYRPHFRPPHPVGAVLNLVHVGRNDRLGKAGPAGARIELVRRSEERLSRHDVDVDARLLVVVVFAREWPFGTRVLGDPMLLRGETVQRCL